MPTVSQELKNTQFIERFRLVHANAYDYSKANITAVSIKIPIIWTKTELSKILCVLNMMLIKNCKK